MISIAATGTSSTGKSALLNALFGTNFEVGAKAGTTRSVAQSVVSFDDRELLVIDTPALGSGSEVVRADVHLLVCDKDLINADASELARILGAGRPLTIVLNKADTYSPAQLRQLKRRIASRVSGVRVVQTSACPVQITIVHRSDGTESHRSRHLHPEVEDARLAVRAMLGEAAESPRVIAREGAIQAARKVRSTLARLKENASEIRRLR